MCVMCVMCVCMRVMCVRVKSDVFVFVLFIVFTASQITQNVDETTFSFVVVFVCIVVLF
jgi:hypothetical protein